MSYFTSSSMGRGAAVLLAWAVSLGCGAQAPAAALKKVAQPSKAVNSVNAVKPAASTAAVANASGAVLSGKGWRVGPRASWVVDAPEQPDSGQSGVITTSAGTARRELLVDFQSNYALPKPQNYTRLRSLATDSSTLGSVSQPQIGFNPAFQTLVVHEASVMRDGRKLDRLSGARIELMRREQRLEQLVIDGTETLLVVLNDVRVGEAVEVAYTLEGENPIYEGRVSTGMRLAWDSPIATLHYRLTVPSQKTLQVKSLATDLQPERFTEGSNQVLRVLRNQVAGVATEQSTPPWFKSHPAVLISEYANWAEVDAWAQKLFAAAPNAIPAANPALAERVATFKATGLTGDALAAEVLRFVQDEVRYFSVSLGESSHRPKPPQRTLAERLGDCKDKVVLLNALLTELGFDAKPALVSTNRNRGLSQFLPGHDEFDHVITRLVLGGTTYFLDATINGQGNTLAERGYYPYGVALVVGSGNADLQAVAEPANALNRMEHEQVWDYSQPGKAATLKTVLRAHGLMAERFRSIVATGGLTRFAQSWAGAYTRFTPGLKSTSEPQLTDDRKANQFQLTQSFEQADPGQYTMGSLDLEFNAFEVLDALLGPPEPRRRTPYLIDQPRVVESRVVVTQARPFTFRAPPVVEVNDRHFRMTTRVDMAGNSATITRRVERRSDEVLPADLASFRENLLKARQQTSTRLRLALVDNTQLTPQFDRIDRRLRAARSYRPDALHNILVRNEVTRMFDSEVLPKIDNASPLAARVLASRALANNTLGDFQAGLKDADAALALDATSEDAQEARGVALVNANRLEDALSVFVAMEKGSRRAMASKWLSAIELLRNRPAEAEKFSQTAVETSGGDERDFAVLWLYMAAEQQGGRGKAAIAPYMAQTDVKKFSGALLHFLDGRIERDALLKIAREKPEWERLNLAEANFYIGQQAAVRGQREEALKWFTRTVETEAVPYREVTFARLQLQQNR
jgi:lipoprotein NlpI